MADRTPLLAPPGARDHAGAPRHAAPLRTPLVVVTGKGGVGKSTVTAALALAAARRGARVTVVEVAARHDVAAILGHPRPGPIAVTRRVADGVDHLSIAPHEALSEYVGRRLPGPAAAVLLHFRLFSLLAAATPGLAELLTIGKVWDLTRAPGAAGQHVVLLDAPATGHALGLLRAPRTFAAATLRGPVARQAAAVDADLRDPRRTSVVVVAAAEDLAVTETLQLAEGLHATVGRGPQRVVVNGLLPDRFTAADLRILRAAPPGPVPRADLSAAARAAHQRDALHRLTAGLGPGVPVATLPFAFAGAPDTAGLAAWGARLDP
ncbi:hypothetical protein FSW04_21015 [Baekduia soli]|uniref:ArsA/GET3 Anion-transporting ATPase-like domain-containing protein n=1 Tax=Baekduia soli TaxID=496014 RepID=A0A5B8UA09_9ACTN|nr:ArsA-related P-loop ATPase [Baekduia soli]QEC49804.1 hypothetical protein FSW04_21015 [Baekduia soli]